MISRLRTRSPKPPPGRLPAGQRWVCQGFAPIYGLRDDHGHPVLGWDWELESAKAAPGDPVVESPTRADRGLARREAVRQRELGF